MATNCSIWDPNPMCLGSEQSAQSEDELANYRKRTASEKADDIFIKEKKCANWEPYTIHPSNPQAIAEGKGISHAEHHVPRYSGPGTKFRFLIISAGPPGSGKTAVVNHIKKDLAIRINKSAATGGIDNPNSAWENLGHDQNIKMDPEFQNKYKEIEHKAKSENDGKKILDNNPNISEYASKIRKLYQSTKSGTEGEKRETKEDMAIKLATQLIGTTDGKIPTKKYIIDKLGTEIQHDTYLYIQVCLSVYLGKNINYETTLKTPKSIEFLATAVNLFSFNCTRYNYIIILGFPIVPHNQLAARIKKRFNDRSDSTGSRLVKNGPPLKTTDIHFIDPILGCQLVDSLRSAYLTIAGIIQRCTGVLDVRTKGDCRDIGIDYLILYDNSDDVNKVQKLYDAIPISQRSYTLLSQSYRDSASALQTNQKNTIIKLLMNNLNCLERVQQSGNEEKKCCPPNRDDETVSICAPLSQESEKACGSMEFADIDKDILSIDYNNDFERLMSRVSESAIQQEIHNENLTSQGIPQGKPVVPFIEGGRRKTRRAKKKRKKQTRRKRKKFRKTHN
jgi:predicted ABC-type ATPase